jgi:hypothetical protein
MSAVAGDGRRLLAALKLAVKEHGKCGFARMPPPSTPQAAPTGRPGQLAAINHYGTPQYYKGKNSKPHKQNWPHLNPQTLSKKGPQAAVGLYREVNW